MFSKAAEYAMRATFYIAQKGSKENKLPITEIAKAIGSPQPFTAKILQMLARDNRIISSIRGPGGGFYISDKARKLPVTAILEAMKEKSTLTKCVMGLPQCSSEKPCPLHACYLKIKLELNAIFDSTTIDEVAKNLDNPNIYLKQVKGR